MRTKSTFSLMACLALTGCYTELYTRGYAARSVDDRPEYRQTQRDPADTGYSNDSSANAQSGDAPSNQGTVIVNNYYHQNPYYRGYLVDEWEYPSVSFGFYSSRYQNYSGAYWWNDPGYSRVYHQGYYRDGNYYPSAGGGNPGPYKSDKRLFSRPAQRPAKGRRSPSGQPAAKKAADGNPAPPPATPPPSGNDSHVSGSNPPSGSDNGSSDDQDNNKEDRPSKGKRR